MALRAANVPDLALPDDDWAAFNLGHDGGIALLEAWTAWLASLDNAARREWRERVQAQRLEHLGLVEFHARHPSLRVPRVLAPITAHYSWSKGLKLLGLGRDQLQLLPDARHAPGRRCTGRSARCLRAHAPARAHGRRRAGHDRIGTVDPVDAVVDARDRWLSRGLGFGVHVDAAWGGYLATLFRNADGSLRTRDGVGRDFRRFPQPDVHAAFAALARTDSITVDPHKLGYLPYGAGAFIARDHRPMALLAEAADYVFHGTTADDYLARYRQLGRFIPEGSKSGAAAAAVYVTHKVLPLDHAHFGPAAAADGARRRSIRRACGGVRPRGRRRSARQGPIRTGQQPGVPGA